MNITPTVPRVPTPEPAVNAAHGAERSQGLISLEDARTAAHALELPDRVQARRYLTEMLPAQVKAGELDEQSAALLKEALLERIDHLPRLTLGENPGTDTYADARAYLSKHYPTHEAKEELISDTFLLSNEDMTQESVRLLGVAVVKAYRDAQLTTQLPPPETRIINDHWVMYGGQMHGMPPGMAAMLDTARTAVEALSAHQVAVDGAAAQYRDLAPQEQEQVRNALLVVDAPPPESRLGRFMTRYNIPWFGGTARGSVALPPGDPAAESSAVERFLARYDTLAAPAQAAVRRELHPLPPA